MSGLAEVVIGTDANGPIIVAAGSRIRVMHAGSVVGIQWPARDAERLAWLIEQGAHKLSLMAPAGLHDVHYSGRLGKFALMQGQLAVVVPNESRAALARAVRAIGRFSVRREGMPNATA